MGKLHRTVFFSSIAVACLSLLFFIGCTEKKDSAAAFGAIEEVNFDISMGKETADCQLALANPSDIERYSALKKLYEAHLPSKVARSETPKIPKILHQIWLGPKTPPAHFVTFREKWKEMHPDWQYRLWTDADLDTLKLELRDLIEASPNYAEKSDILRCELLEQFGGVYLDVDMDPLHALDELHHKYDFYAGIENPHKIATTDNRIWAGISIMAAKPHHPILAKWKQEIRAGWDRVNVAYTSPVERVINHTYFPFSVAVFAKLQEGTNIFFPATYFYPLTASEASKRRSSVRSVREKMYDFLEKIHLMKRRAFSHVYPETIAVHYWTGTWQGSSQEQLKMQLAELKQQMDFLKKDFFTLQERLKQMEQTKGISSTDQVLSMKK